MVHVGSLFAVVVYFWRDVVSLLGGIKDIFRGRVTVYTRLVTFIAFATVPAVLFGLYLKYSGLSNVVRSVELVAWGAIFFGILMYLADLVGKHAKKMQDMTLGAAMLIGIAQAIALIPGTSRSGITMTAARFMGFERGEAARFSFLLGIPAIIASASTPMRVAQNASGERVMQPLSGGNQAKCSRSASPKQETMCRPKPRSTESWRGDLAAWLDLVVPASVVG